MKQEHSIELVKLTHMVLQAEDTQQAEIIRVFSMYHEEAKGDQKVSEWQVESCW